VGKGARGKTRYCDADLFLEEAMMTWNLRAEAHKDIGWLGFQWVIARSAVAISVTLLGRVFVLAISKEKKCRK
jgi:hypothetical protein